MLSSIGLAGNGKKTGKEALIKNAIESFINIHRHTKPKARTIIESSLVTEGFYRDSLYLERSLCKE